MIRLGSNSITRADILKSFGIDFIQNGGDFDEDTIKTKIPKEFCYQASKKKFEELFKKYGINEMPLLVADSVVSCEGKLLRKAKDYDDAKSMLELQSGNKTSVITCMIYKDINKELLDISITTYEFDIFDEADMQNYLNSKECFGKAGAIMVEGFCKKYIKSVNGYESTAMGLCIEKLKMFI